MTVRWLLFGLPLLFGALTVVFARRGDLLQAAVAAVQAVAALGLSWYAVREDGSDA